MAQTEILIPLVSLSPSEANSGVYTAVGTNIKQDSVAFDDSTAWYRNGTIKVPADVDTTGTVTLRIVGRSATAASGKTVQFDFDHRPIGNDEAGDPASPYTTESSGGKTTSSTQDNNDIITWTETISNLGWAAGDEVFFRLYRNPAGTDTLVGDYYVFSLAIIIPLT